MVLKRVCIETLGLITVRSEFECTSTSSTGTVSTIVFLGVLIDAYRKIQKLMLRKQAKISRKGGNSKKLIFLGNLPNYLKTRTLVLLFVYHRNQDQGVILT